MTIGDAIEKTEIEMYTRTIEKCLDTYGLVHGVNREDNETDETYRIRILDKIIKGESEE